MKNPFQFKRHPSRPAVPVPSVALTFRDNLHVTQWIEEQASRKAAQQITIIARGSGVEQWTILRSALADVESVEGRQAAADALGTFFGLTPSQG